MRMLVALLPITLTACGSVSGWPTSTLEAEGIDSTRIDAVVADIEAGDYGRVDHFLMVRHGKLVCDHHFPRDYAAMSAALDPKDEPYDYDHPGWHPYYRGTDLHTLQSVTKSITSICIGIAIDEGLIPDGVQTPAMSFFSDFEPDMSDPRRQAMTLEDLLTMRSGIDWNESIPYTDERNSCVQLELSDDWVRFVLGHPMREDPGTKFDYNSGVSVLLGKIVRVATGRRIDDYAREKLFEPLGIRDSYWKVTPCGENDTEGGLYLSAHDLAKVVQLMLQKGEWNGRRIVSERWVEASIGPHTAIDPQQPDGVQYGYQWWVPVVRNGEVRQFQGSGYGGQYPIVLPKLDTVIVFNAWNTNEQPKKPLWNAVRNELVPAIR